MCDKGTVTRILTRNRGLYFAIYCSQSFLQQLIFLFLWHLALLMATYLFRDISRSYNGDTVNFNQNFTNTAEVQLRVRRIKQYSLGLVSRFYLSLYDPYSLSSSYRQSFILLRCYSLEPLFARFGGVVALRGTWVQILRTAKYPQK